MSSAGEMTYGAGFRVHVARGELPGGRFLYVVLALMLLGANYGRNLEAQQLATASIRGQTTALCQVGICPLGHTLNLVGARLGLTEKSPASSRFTTTSNSNGFYEFSNLPAGSYTLEITLAGFRSYSTTLTLSPGEALVKNVQMEIAGVHQQIEVRGHTAAVAAQNAAPPAILTSHQIMSVPLSQKQNFVDALPLVPGVVRTPDGKLNMKGSVENEGMMLVNSMQAIDPVTGSFAIQVPLDMIETLHVYKTPYSAEYGGFSGGLTSVETKPPGGRWDYNLMDFMPGINGKAGHIVGISDWTPRFFFGGPMWKNKLNFSEEFTYEVNKTPIRGLAWPHNETKEQGFNSFSSLQYILSPRHLVTANVNVFPLRQEFADINSLVPQTASSNYGQRGFSVDVTDSYQFKSNALLTTSFKVTQFSSYAHGQGLQDMLITPEGWGGNFFNAWTRSANEEEVLSILQLPTQRWLGQHTLDAGVDFTRRAYSGASVSQPVELLRENGSRAAQINFLPGGPLSSRDTEVAEFIQDRWAMGQHLAFDLGSRLTSQSIGRRAAYAPRAGLVYSPDGNGRTILRTGSGVFYDRAPLLGADFSENPTQIVTFYDENGIPTGAPIVFQNIYMRNGSERFLGAGNHDLSASPRNFTWNVEVDREIRPDMILRLSYLYSDTTHLFAVNPMIGPSGSNSFLGLTDTGGSHYHEFEATLHIHPNERAFLNISYVRSRARGDLNTLSDIFVPFEEPVIRPDFTADLDSDVPNRLVSWGVFRLPWNLTVSPVVDLHSGFPYSNVDVLQNYVGLPNSQRFPTFFSLDFKVYREFRLPLPFLGRMRNRRFRLGVYSINATNHSNPHDVFNNVASPFFGHFDGFQHRLDGFVLDVVD